jgi:hypothetical protein
MVRRSVQSAQYIWMRTAGDILHCYEQRAGTTTDRPEVRYDALCGDDRVIPGALEITPEGLSRCLLCLRRMLRE